MRKLLSLLTIGLMVWALSSCARDDPEPELEPTPTPTPATARPSPTATPPMLGGQVSRYTEEGAAAFFHYFVDVMNYATVTGDLEEFNRITVEECEGCEVIRSEIRRTYDAGGYIVGSEWVIQELELEPKDAGALMTVQFIIKPGQVADSATADLTDTVASDITIYAWTVRNVDRWVLAEFGTELVE